MFIYFVSHTSLYIACACIVILLTQASFAFCGFTAEHVAVFSVQKAFNVSK